MNTNHFKFILSSIIVWRIFLILILLLAIEYIPLQNNFLGGGKEMYLKNPVLWAWGNYDGEHYLSIARLGYKPLQYYFFPLYPFVVGFITKLISGGSSQYIISGLLVSHVFFIIGLIGFWKLVILDYSNKIGKLAFILILLFPTSFYFVSFYTESLFFALVIWSFYFARNRKWLLAGIVGALASATRIIGIMLIPALIAELLVQYFNSTKRNPISDLYLNIFKIFIVSFGLMGYMFFLYKTTGNYFMFRESGYIYGEYWSSKPVLLPQVFYRYIFKIIPNLTWSYFPQVFSTFLEFLTALLLTALSVIGIARLRLSYWIFMLLGFLFPVLYVNFVSLPRYALVLFPMFILSADLLSNRNQIIKYIIYVLLLGGLIISTIMFSRGFRIA